MRIKAGNIFLENGNNEDAIFEWDLGKTVDIVTGDGYLIARIDPSDLIAVSDAISAEIERELRRKTQNKKCG